MGLNTQLSLTAKEKAMIVKWMEQGANRKCLLRHVTMDLTGLPPTIDEIDSFLKDTSTDAHEKVVDGLLATDDFGYNISQRPVYVHDFQAILMHLLGVDHEKLTFKFQGRRYRLTDVYGEVVKEILA